MPHVPSLQKKVEKVLLQFTLFRVIQSLLTVSSQVQTASTIIFSTVQYQCINMYCRYFCFQKLHGYVSKKNSIILNTHNALKILIISFLTSSLIISKLPYYRVRLIAMRQTFCLRILYLKRATAVLLGLELKVCETHV